MARVRSGKVKAYQSLTFTIDVKGNLSAPLPEKILSMDKVKEFYAKKDIQKDYDGCITYAAYICDFTLDNMFSDYYDLEIETFDLLEDGETSKFRMDILSRPEIEVGTKTYGYPPYEEREINTYNSEDFYFKKKKDFNEGWQNEVLGYINYALTSANISSDEITCTGITLTELKEAEYDAGDIDYNDEEYEDYDY